MAFEMRQLGNSAGSSTSQLSLLGPQGPSGGLAGAGLSLAVLGSGQCVAGPRPALRYLERGGVPQASGAQLSVQAPVFPLRRGLPTLPLLYLCGGGGAWRGSTVMSCAWPSCVRISGG